MSKLDLTDKKLQFFLIENQKWILKAESDSRWNIILCHLRQFDTKEKIQNWIHLYQKLLLANVSFEKSIGLDFAACSGFGGFLLSHLGSEQVFCLEKEPLFKEFVSCYDLETESLSFVTNNLVDIPVEQPLDWIWVNQVFCNLDPQYQMSVIKAMGDCLKPGGKVLLTDSNNPHHEPTRRKIKASFRDLEIGQGSLDCPQGRYYMARRQYLASQTDRLTADELSLLARETCYFCNDALDQALLRYLSSKKTPESCFKEDSDQVPVAWEGSVPSRLTDPLEMVEQFKRCGLNAFICYGTPAKELSLEKLNDNLRKRHWFYIVAEKP